MPCSQMEKVMYGPASVFFFFCRLKLTRLGQSRDSHTQSERLDLKTFSISHNESNPWMVGWVRLINHDF